MGKRPMSSVYSLIIGSYQMCSSLIGRTGSGVGGEEVASDADQAAQNLVESGCV